MAPSTVYIHELIDITGHGRARYMHHMTANWVPVARRERHQKCFGVWATVGSTGPWPQVVNMWEVDSWEALATDFEHELRGAGMQDPSLAEWWATAAGLRRGGVDRILVPADGNRTIDDLVADGAGGGAYAHELVTTEPGGAERYLELLAAHGQPAAAAQGLTLLGAWRVAMVNDSEVVVIWSIPDHHVWAAYEQATRTDAALLTFQRLVAEVGADWRRTLMVDAPLAPLRIGRQPDEGDRRPLEEI